MRVVATSENHLDEMRRRLMMTAFCPERSFHLLHANPTRPKSDPVSAEDLRLWLTKTSEFPIPVSGQDIEALIMRYSGGPELDMAGFLRVITPRDCKESRDGPRETGRQGFQSQRGNPARAAHSQASIRLAQLFERELQLIRDVMVRQHELHRLGLHPADSLALLAGTTGRAGRHGGVSLEGLRKNFTPCGSKALHLTFDEQTAVVRHLSLTRSIQEVTSEEWDRFMRLGSQFITPGQTLDIKSFTKECRVCSARIQRPYISCPDCGQKMYGPTEEFSQTLLKGPLPARTFATPSHDTPLWWLRL
jgi:hypothetical protein